MAVIFVNRFFYPYLSATSQLLSDLAFDLAKTGRQIHVITSRLHYDEATDTAAPLASHTIVELVAIHRVWTSRFGRGRLLGRTVDYLTFYGAALWRLWRLTRSGDVVVVKTDPPLISVIAALVCLLRRAHLVNWLQDLFPEAALAHGIGRRWGPGYSLLRWMRTAALRRAAANVVIGHMMGERLEELGVPSNRIRLIPNWSDGTAVRPMAHVDNSFRREAGLGDAFVVAYSGNLGRVHDTATLLDAMRILAASSWPAPPEIRWLFIGGGALTPMLKAEVARHGFANVTFRSYQPRSALAMSLSAADAHLASLRPEFEGLIVPSKVSGAMAAGRPILFVGDPNGEIGRLIARYDCGYAIAPGHGARLAQAIVELARDPDRSAQIGRQARSAFEKEFERASALAKWEELLNAVSAGDRSA